jgi:hypothetical protein
MVYTLVRALTAVMVVHGHRVLSARRRRPAARYFSFSAFSFVAARRAVRRFDDFEA